VSARAPLADASHPSYADELVYDAEAAWVHDLRETAPGSPMLVRLRSVVDAEELALRFAAAAGGRLGAVTVSFTIAETDWRGGCAHAGDVIELRPLVESWALAHEIAHLVSATFDHSDRFLVAYLEIVTVHGGPRAVRSLREQLRRHGVAPFGAAGRPGPGRRPEHEPTSRGAGT
jgi:hypothetical protein